MPFLNAGFAICGIPDRKLRRTGSNPAIVYNLKLSSLAVTPAGVAQLVEHHVANVVVEGSSPFTRFFLLTSGCVEAALVRKLPQQQSPCSRSTFTLDLNWRAALCDCFLSVAQSALQNCWESCVPRELCRVFDAFNAFYAIRTESGTPANYSQVAQSFAPGAVAVHARICYHHRK